jgi:hypothetical protein
MTKNKDSGELGEMEVIEKVPCPNCNNKLMQLPPNYPLADLQCTGCKFRVQVKTSITKPKSEILGSGWEILDKSLKSGEQITPLIVNFKWKDKQKILFFPFIQRNNLKKRQLPPTARRANYKMFNYVGLDKLPHFTLYEH